MMTSDLMNRIRAAVAAGTDDLVHSMGLERRRTAGEKIVAAITVFGAGLVVGAGLGLLFAPKSGRELRSDIGTGVGKVGEKARQLGERVRHAVEERVDASSTTPHAGGNNIRHV
jgi:hypothetical protein